jgi:hypothetical protein
MATRTLGLIVILLLLAPAWATAGELVRLEKPALYDLQRIGFELDRDTDVEVSAVGRTSHDRNASWGWLKDIAGDWNDDWDDEGELLDVYAWILDAQTREPVWVMLAGDTDRYQRSRTLRDAESRMDLPAGRYELYFYSGYGWMANMTDEGRWSGKSRREWRGLQRDMEEVEEDLAECFVSLSSDDVGTVRTFEPTGELDGALIELTRLGDGAFERAGFELREEMGVRVYAITEYALGSDAAADFGWITDADTGERVWDMSDRRGSRAGGARKNRLIDRDVRLDAGRYVLTFGTDDSHSYEQFNANPPYDPMNWGVTLLPGRNFDASAFSTFDPPSRGEPVIDFSRARDSDFREQGFRLANDADLYVFALGEGEDRGWTFYDYGWIADAKTGKTVWEMDDRNTYPGGGAEKNRMHDGVIHLEAGDYIAFYVTDGSHSYEEWNAAAPFEPEQWGMSIYPAGSTSRSDIQLVDSDELEEGSGILARIVRVGDHERIRESFTLDRPTRVEVYALGEGDDDEMYDYGYIRDRDSRHVVWEMEYRDTEHAGGASKNRMVREEIELEPGEYEVVYVSDGSHSFEGWNDRRPDDPLSWGITVRIAR